LFVVPKSISVGSTPTPNVIQRKQEQHLHQKTSQPTQHQLSQPQHTRSADSETKTNKSAAKNASNTNQSETRNNAATSSKYKSEITQQKSTTLLHPQGRNFARRSPNAVLQELGQRNISSMATIDCERGTRSNLSQHQHLGDQQQ
jgi:hypothetical protein